MRLYACFDGRCARGEYLWWNLFLLLSGLAARALDAILGSAGLVDAALSLAVLLPIVAATVRRLHDLDRSGWWMLLGPVPLAGWIAALAWSFTRGDAGPNRFGPPSPLAPRPPPEPDGASGDLAAWRPRRFENPGAGRDPAP